jgi:uncharacterized protein YcbK (DUF882 family)
MQNYFTDSELKCKCCGKLIIDELFLAKLNAARAIAEFQFIVTSGYRCIKHNADVGSTSSNHTSGKAADIRCLDSFDRFYMVRAMLEAGMLGIGISKEFIHCDINRSSRDLWTY